MIYNHAIFSLCTMTGFLALVLSVSLFCKSIAEAKEWKEKFGALDSGLSPVIEKYIDGRFY